jgi:hypothetical protein
MFINKLLNSMDGNMAYEINLLYLSTLEISSLFYSYKILLLLEEWSMIFEKLENSLSRPA